MSKRGNVDQGLTARALKIFGRRKLDVLVKSFKSAANQSQDVPSDKLEYLLRSNGLCPSKQEMSELSELLRNRRGLCSLEAFLEIAMQCESVSTTCGMSELIEFFAPYDLENRGVVGARVFRQVMRKCGETFTDREIDDIIEAFHAIGQRENVDYRAFITTITGN